MKAGNALRSQVSTHLLPDFSSFYTNSMSSVNIET